MLKELWINKIFTVLNQQKCRAISQYIFNSKYNIIFLHSLNSSLSKSKVEAKKFTSFIFIFISILKSSSLYSFIIIIFFLIKSVSFLFQSFSSNNASFICSQVSTCNQSSRIYIYIYIYTHTCIQRKRQFFLSWS